MKKTAMVALLGLGLLMSACSTVTISPGGKAKLSTAPDYQERKSFFIYGLVGEEEVNVSEICGGKEPRQMQTQDTFMDSFLGIVTFGIYAPRTVKVWCGEEA